MFIWPCYPSEVLKGGEWGVPFVPQEPADGCNPFQNAHWKSIKTGWTWCMSVEAGDTFLRVGVPQRNTSWIKQASLVLSRQKWYCKERQKEWIATATKEGPLCYPSVWDEHSCHLFTVSWGWHGLQGVQPQKKLQTLTSYPNKARDIHCGRTRENRLHIAEEDRWMDGWILTSTCSQWQCSSTR